jgi:hypothetical protein
MNPKRLLARPFDDLLLSISDLPGQGWDADGMTEPSGYGVSLEYICNGPEHGDSALFVNCRDAYGDEVTRLMTDPEGVLQDSLEGTCSFATCAEGTLRSIGGLVGYVTSHQVEDQFGGTIFAVSGDLVWQAEAVSDREVIVGQLLSFAETVILPQFLEPSGRPEPGTLAGADNGD